jgi:hypothetical protein
LNLPTAQSRHELAARNEYAPAGHRLQLALLLNWLKLPITHAVQVVAVWLE